MYVFCKCYSLLTRQKRFIVLRSYEFFFNLYNIRVVDFNATPISLRDFRSSAKRAKLRARSKINIVASKIVIGETMSKKKEEKQRNEERTMNPSDYS